MIKLNYTKLFQYCIAISIVILASVQSCSAQSATAELQSIRNQLQSIQGHFNQRIYNSRGQIKQSSQGSMAIARPGKFRWEITSPVRQTFVTDGRNVWIYDKDLAQVTVQKAGSDGGNT